MNFMGQSVGQYIGNHLHFERFTDLTPVYQCCHIFEQSERSQYMSFSSLLSARLSKLPLSDQTQCLNVFWVRQLNVKCFLLLKCFTGPNGQEVTQKVPRIYLEHHFDGGGSPRNGHYLYSHSETLSIHTPPTISSLSRICVRIWINNCIQEFQWNILSIYEFTSKMV